MKKIFSIYKKYQEIINYLIVGVLTTFVSLLTYYACVVTFLDPKEAVELQIANIISWICAVSFAYVTNRVFVFKSKSKDILKELSSFVGSRVLTLIADMLIMFTMVTVMGLNDKFSKLVVQVVVTVLNYVFSKMFVFNKKSSIKKI